MKLKKKSMLVIAFLAILSISMVVGYALNANDPRDVIHVTKTGETAHGNYELSVHNTELQEAESGFMGVLDLSADPGYYVKNLTVTYNDQPLQLGFEAGSEHGNFFREYEFSPGNLNYEFMIPNDATEENKVQIEIEYAEKAPIDITYMNYEKDSYRDEEVTNPENYGEEKVLVTGYRDGDIVLPNDCLENGCGLKLQFANADDYNSYKSAIMNPEWNDSWIKGSADVREGQRGYNTLYAGRDGCDDEAHFCYVVLSKDFNKVAYGVLDVGYTEMYLFSPDFIGFDVVLDVDNFADILHETGNETISFTNNKLELDMELFYGTKKIQLLKKKDREIINNNLEKNTGILKDFDSVTGSGFAYDSSYENGNVIITINSYYQDKLTIELTLKNNNQNIFDDNVKINLNRFAFSGNGGQLLEVDSEGRNCAEENNGNRCDDGRYYSTQYRGVFSFLYTDEDDEGTELDSALEIYDVQDNTLLLGDRGRETVYRRNKDFNPHAIALFYDKNNMIVEIKDIDLNDSVQAEGYVKKNLFLEKYVDYTFSPNPDKDYVYFNYRFPTSIHNIEYFHSHLEGTIMHDMVLIGVDEAQEKGIVKIALFIVNGEIEENSIPELTYGIGEGKVLMIHGGRA